MNELTKPLAAEFIGTFALIFIGAGAGTVLGGGEIPGIAFAHGLTIMIFAYAFGDISGCHINPAVTVGLAAAGKFPTRRVGPYVAAQLAGAIAAGYWRSLACSIACSGWRDPLACGSAPSATPPQNSTPAEPPCRRGTGRREVKSVLPVLRPMR
jgi:glycerol uptake facilitator-like aquaporin